MAPLPKKKHTRSRSNQRRSANFKVTLAFLGKCPSCGKLKEPHKSCRFCGYHHLAKGSVQAK